jgi:hypothetical protein
MLRYSSILTIIIVLISLAGCISNESTDDKEEYPLCETKYDIDKYNGEYVELVGTYDHQSTGKEVDHIVLKDSNTVIVDFNSELEDLDIYNNQTVKVIGKLEKTNYIESDQSTSIARISDIKSFEIID